MFHIPLTAWLQITLVVAFYIAVFCAICVFNTSLFLYHLKNMRIKKRMLWHKKSVATNGLFCVCVCVWIWIENIRVFFFTQHFLQTNLLSISKQVHMQIQNEIYKDKFQACLSWTTGSSTNNNGDDDELLWHINNMP